MLYEVITDYALVRKNDGKWNDNPQITPNTENKVLRLYQTEKAKYELLAEILV